MSISNLTVKERLRLAIKQFNTIDNGPGRADSAEYQERLSQLLAEFGLIRSIVEGLSLFSSNEKLAEINAAYLPFIAISFYEGCLFMKSLADVRGLFDEANKLQFKEENLQRAKIKFASYLHQLESIGEVLTEVQKGRINAFEKSYNPSVEELLNFEPNPANRRAEKMENYKLEKDLRGRLQILDEYYLREIGSKAEEDDLESLSEDIVRSVFVDQLKLFALQAFANLELLAAELKVLEQRSEFESRSRFRESAPKREVVDSTGYTTRLERNPREAKKMSDLLTRQGKILQPFVITNNKQEVRRQVFGTGQTLPSMTVEEYLDYELANGKMLKDEVKDGDGESDDEDDSDEEMRKRNWDDWKDENPRGSGNMKGNLG